MKSTQMTEEHKKELLVFIGAKSRLGILFIFQGIFGLLGVIGFLCMLFSYSQTELDGLVGLLGTTISIIGALFFVVALIFILIMSTVIQKGIIEDKRESAAKKLIGFSVGIGIACLFSLIMVIVADILYEPESGAFIALVLAAGFYLSVLGLMGALVCNIIFVMSARKVLLGIVNREQLLFKKPESVQKKEEEPVQERTLEEKLTELKRLKDNGILSEEEFETKKKELLQNLK